MQLRLKLAAIASATALAVSLGLALAGPAAAVDEQALCVTPTTHNGVLCAFNFDGLGQTVSAVGPPGGYWDMPGVRGQITSDLAGSGGNVHLCMELDASDHDYIVMAYCQGKASEEWTAEAGHNSGTTVYVNGYKTNLCLNVYPFGEYPQLIGYTCSKTSLNQEFYPHLSPN